MSARRIRRHGHSLSHQSGHFVGIVAAALCFELHGLVRRETAFTCRAATDAAAEGSWLIEATKYNVLPMDDRTSERLKPTMAGRPTLIRGDSQEFAIEAGVPIPEGTHQVRMELAYDGGGRPRVATSPCITTAQRSVRAVSERPSR
jgi:hypothetical protein